MTAPAYDTINSVAPRAPEILSEAYILLNVDLPAGSALTKGQVMGRVDATGVWGAADSGASNGAQIIRGVLMHDVATSASARKAQLFVFGKLNAALPFGAGYTATQIAVQCFNSGIFLEGTI